MNQLSTKEFRVVGIDSIHIPRDWRTMSLDAVQGLMKSIREIGLQVPITIRHPGSDDGEDECPSDGFILVAGRHRLEAFRLLGWNEITCAVIPPGPGAEREARLWYISENLHRAEMSKLDRKKMQAEWIRLTQEKLDHRNPAQDAQVCKGGRGNKGGLSAAVKELGISRREGQRALVIANIIPEAENLVRECGIADNQDKLLKIGAVPPEQQVETVKSLIAQPPPQSEFNAKAKWLEEMTILWRRAHPNWQAEFLRQNPYYPAEGKTETAGKPPFSAFHHRR